MKQVKYQLSFRFLEAAKYYADEAFRYEEHEEKPNDYYNFTLFSGIISIVTFLEAYINEFYSEFTENHIHTLNPIMSNYKDEIITLCKNEISTTKNDSKKNKKSRILVKYDNFLEVVKLKKMDGSRYPCRDVIALISLRNTLIHHNPIWQNVYKEDKESRLKKLLNKKYQLCPYYDEKEEPFFPNLCLSADCLQWSIRSSLALISDFQNKLNNIVPLKENFTRTLKKLNINAA